MVDEIFSLLILIVYIYKKDVEKNNVFVVEVGVLNIILYMVEAFIALDSNIKNKTNNI